MKSANETMAIIAELRTALADNNLATIDFDRFASILDDLSAVCQSAVADESDLTLLRDDCITRITGLAKAIAAARSSPGTDAQIVEFIDALPTFTAAELLATFRRISARFRDTFPASHKSPSLTN